MWNIWCWFQTFKICLQEAESVLVNLFQNPWFWFMYYLMLTDNIYSITYHNTPQKQQAWTVLFCYDSHLWVTQNSQPITTKNQHGTFLLTEYLLFCVPLVFNMCVIFSSMNDNVVFCDSWVWVPGLFWAEKQPTVLDKYCILQVLRILWFPACSTHFHSTPQWQYVVDIQQSGFTEA